MRYYLSTGWNAPETCLRHDLQKIHVRLEAQVVYSVRIMEESVFNDLDRLLFLELEMMYRISKHLSDKSGSAGRAALRRKKKPGRAPGALEQLPDSKTLATSVRQLQ